MLLFYLVFKLLLTTILLGIFLTAAWVLGIWSSQYYAMIGLDLILLVAAGLAIIFTMFFFVMRFFTYVQPYQKYLKFVTPFLRMNISYRRMVSVRPVLVQQVPLAPGDLDSQNRLALRPMRTTNRELIAGDEQLDTQTRVFHFLRQHGRNVNAKQ